MLTLEEMSMATTTGIMEHYGLIPAGLSFDEVLYIYMDWKRDILKNFTGANFYEKHDHWYKVRYSKLGQVLK